MTPALLLRDGFQVREDRSVVFDRVEVCDRVPSRKANLRQGISATLGHLFLTPELPLSILLPEVNELAALGVVRFDSIRKAKLILQNDEGSVLAHGHIN